MCKRPSLLELLFRKQPTEGAHDAIREEVTQAMRNLEEASQRLNKAIDEHLRVTKANTVTAGRHP